MQLALLIHAILGTSSPLCDPALDPALNPALNVPLPFLLFTLPVLFFPFELSNKGRRER